MSRFSDQVNKVYSVYCVDHVINAINRVDLVCSNNLPGQNRTTYFNSCRTLKLSKTPWLLIIYIQILCTKRRKGVSLSDLRIWEKPAFRM